LREARHALGADVVAAVPVSGAAGAPEYLAALVREHVRFHPQVRWVVLLERAGGGWRVRSRHHTHLPVRPAPTAFGIVDADGDGRPEIFTIGTAVTLGGVSVGVDLLDPRGPVSRYTITGSGLDAQQGSAVWTPELDRRPRALAWAAGTAHAALAKGQAWLQANGSHLPGAVDIDPLTPAQAFEEARQRLGWGVRRAIPMRGECCGQHIAVLYGPATVAVLAGNDHVYDWVTPVEVPWSRVSGAYDSFGVMDADRDGTDEVYVVSSAEGTAEWVVGVTVFDPATRESSSYTLTGDPQDPGASVPQATASPGLAGKRALRAWMDSTVREAAAAEGYGPPVPPSSGEARARQAERTWQARGDSLSEVVLAGAPPGARCTVDDGGVTWTSRYRGGLWAYDRARRESRVVYVPETWSTAMVVGKRYVWTNLTEWQGGGRMALLAYDKRARAPVAFPIPGLAAIAESPGPMSVRDGHIEIDGTPLPPPPGIDMAAELAGAGQCDARFDPPSSPHPATAPRHSP